MVASSRAAEWCYRQLSCPGSVAAAVAEAAEQIGAALAAEQLEQPAAEGAGAWQPAAVAAAAEQQLLRNFLNFFILILSHPNDLCLSINKLFV